MALALIWLQIYTIIRVALISEHIQTSLSLPHCSEQGCGGRSVSGCTGSEPRGSTTSTLAEISGLHARRSCLHVLRRLCCKKIGGKKVFAENLTCLTWSHGQMIPPENIKRYPMATRHAQMTREKTRRSFLKIDSIQTSTNTARKMASAVGTVMTKATWSSTFWEEMAEKHSTQD